MSNTIFLGHSNKGHDGFVGHSYLGRWVNIGAGTITSNLKNTYGTVALWTPSGVRDTGMQFLGTMFGDHVKTGIGLRLTTGTVIGAGANVYGSMPPKTVAPFSWGDAPNYPSYRADKFVETAARMMARRHVELSDRAHRHLDRGARRRAGPSRSTRREDLDARQRQPRATRCSSSATVRGCSSTAATERARSPRGCKTIDVNPESIDGCLITHEHTDHVSGAAAAAKRWGWRLYATAGTASAAELTGKHVQHFEPGTTLDFPRMTVTSTRIPHDANGAVGFVIESRSTGARAGLFYDIGYVTRRIAKACESLDILVIESNHDEDMLRYGPYSPSLQAAHRVARRAPEQPAKPAASRARW